MGNCIMVQIDLNPDQRPETCALEPKTAEDKLKIIENLLAQHGLQMKDVTRSDNPIQEHHWFALVRFEGRIMDLV